MDIVDPQCFLSPENVYELQSQLGPVSTAPTSSRVSTPQYPSREFVVVESSGTYVHPSAFSWNPYSEVLR